MRAAWLFVLALLLAPFVLAQPFEDFSVASAQVLQAVQAGSIDSRLLITNTGETASTYSIAVIDSPVVPWLTYDTVAFTLDSGEARTVLLHLDIPRNATAKEYLLQTVITTVAGTELTIEQAVQVSAPHNIALFAQNQTTTPCAPAEFIVKLNNTGAFSENYELSARIEEKLDARFSQNKTLLEPGKNATITLTVQPKDCSRTGTVTFTVTGFANSTQQAELLELVLTIENPFVPAFEISDVRLNTSENTFNASITNTGNKNATFAIGVIGADFVLVTPTTLSLESKETKSVTIVSQPTNKTVQKEYAMNLTATIGKQAYHAPFVLTIRNLTWIETHSLLAAAIILVLIIGSIICIALLRRWIAYMRTPEYQEARQEKMRIAEEHRAQKAKEKEAARKQREKELAERKAQLSQKQKEKEQAKFEVRIEHEREKSAKEARAALKSEYVLVSKEMIKSDTAKKPSAALRVLFALIFVTAIVALGILLRNKIEGYDVVISGIALALSILAAAFILITNKVVQRWTALKSHKEYLLATGWKSGLRQLWLRVNDVMLNASLAAFRSAGSAASNPEGDVYQHLTVTPDNIREDSLETLRFLFRVPAKWAEKHSNIKLMRYTADGTWKGVGTEKRVADKNWSAYCAETGCFGQFAIVGTKREEKPKHSLLVPVLCCIAVLAILAGGVFYLASAGKERTTVVSSSSDKGIPAQIWDEDSARTIDLKTYFKDPDNDALAFKSTPLYNIVITISNGIATLQPKKDWHGNETVVFFADDGKGEIVESNEVMLIVRETPELTFWTALLRGIEQYAAYLVAGIVLLCLIIVAMRHGKDK